MALHVHYSLVVCIGPCFCGFHGLHGHRGINKPALSAGGDESVNVHHSVSPASNLSQLIFSCQPIPAIYLSISTNHAHIPHWGGEAMWCLLAISCWQPLSGGRKRFSVIKCTQWKKTSNKHACSPIFTFSRPWGVGGWRWKVREEASGIFSSGALILGPYFRGRSQDFCCAASKNLLRIGEKANAA